MLLLELAHLLLHQAEQDETQPLPFVVPLASWANRRLPFQEWLIGQVKGLYEVPLRLSRQWVEAEQVLPLLDGLDEMEEAARAECVAAINTYHREHLRPLVVCSRTQEYELATRREQLALGHPWWWCNHLHRSRWRHTLPLLASHLRSYALHSKGMRHLLHWQQLP